MTPKERAEKVADDFLKDDGWKGCWLTLLKDRIADAIREAVVQERGRLSDAMVAVGRKETESAGKAACLRCLDLIWDGPAP